MGQMRYTAAESISACGPDHATLQRKTWQKGWLCPCKRAEALSRSECLCTQRRFKRDRRFHGWDKRSSGGCISDFRSGYTSMDEGKSSDGKSASQHSGKYNEQDVGSLLARTRDKANSCKIIIERNSRNKEVHAKYIGIGSFRCGLCAYLIPDDAFFPVIWQAGMQIAENVPTRADGITVSSKRKGPMSIIRLLKMWEEPISSIQKIYVW